MNTSVRNRLSAMMFLEFFIWGAWVPLIAGYLGKNGLQFTELEQSWILSAFPLASFTAMFFSTQFADRNFAAERFLAVSQLIGGVAILSLTWVTTFWPFFLLMLLHSLFYVPTISITNSIAFANLKDAQDDFARVRLWGTIGWIVASVPFVFILTDWTKVSAFGSVPSTTWLGEALGTPLPSDQWKTGVRFIFLTAGVASLLMAGFSLLLPHTPPKRAGFMEKIEPLAWLEAMKLLRMPFLLVLFIVTFFDSAVHDCYFIWAGRFLEHVGIASNWVMPVMTIGQIAEIGTLAFLGFFLKNLGWKTTMIVGILGHTLRFGLFALAPFEWIAVSVNVVHGICYAFFFATVYIFVDEFPQRCSFQHQGLFNFLILGLGPLASRFVWPKLGGVFQVEETGDYRDLFLVPAGVSLFAALLLALFFYPPKKAATNIPIDKPPLAEGTAPIAASPGIQGTATGVKD